jgi:protein-L-isoaspartate(D-aspartate) O-methyltransferase
MDSSRADATVAREHMVRTQIRERGISDPRVLAALGAVPRERFVAPFDEELAYTDQALVIGHGQTISQPFMVGMMTQALSLRPDERVLEIGTGSGYQTVLLSHLVDQVFSIERVAPLMESAQQHIRSLGVNNVSLLVGDGTVGWREYAPYDAILVSAASPDVPTPLLGQLADGGRMLVPVGGRHEQTLVLVTRRGDGFEREELDAVRFVPLLGRHGWTP